MGLEALVLRTHDAQATHERLRDAGYAVNPVQDLRRPALADGKQVEARFHTVRFAEQPVAGLRMYFCRHLTPEYVWTPDLMRHSNGARAVVRIDARAADPQKTAARIADVAAVPLQQAGSGWDVLLGNATLHVGPADAGAGTGLVSLTLERADGSRHVMDIAQ
jgi:hypothetical protein